MVMLCYASRAGRILSSPTTLALAHECRGTAHECTSAGTHSIAMLCVESRSYRERDLCWQPTGPSPPNRLDDLVDRPCATRVLNSLVHVASYLPSYTIRLPPSRENQVNSSGWKITAIRIDFVRCSIMSASCKRVQGEWSLQGSYFSNFRHWILVPLPIEEGKTSEGFPPESQGQILALTVLYVPYWLDG